MTIHYSTWNIESDDLAWDEEAASWDELAVELGVTVEALKNAYVNNLTLEVNGSEIVIESVYG